MKVPYKLRQTVRGQGQEKVYTGDVEVEIIKKKDTFLRYKETLDEHELDVVMGLGTHDIRLSRNGIIQMNFHFVPGVHTDTFYESPAGRHHFRLFTKRIESNVKRVVIEYDLYEADECIGQYLYILESSD